MRGRGRGAWGAVVPAPAEPPSRAPGQRQEPAKTMASNSNSTLSTTLPHHNKTTTRHTLDRTATLPPRRHSLGASNMKVMWSPLSSLFIVMASSLPAHFRILDRLASFMPANGAAEEGVWAGGVEVDTMA